jgi:hypothetical protein
MTYHEQLDAFVLPKPFDGYILNEQTAEWEPPTPKPDGDNWVWDEETTSWRQQ